ncbi:uncharacterized protein [Diabrotica undecimpunctata]|uniref:uncharacterized protein n=1 Tax=Diabrotica undecimpunctata TaxID=50387 RepID=UPI003B63CA0C
MHYDDNIDNAIGKPKIIIDYNNTKKGVDVVDKLCAAYNCARATRRWPMVIFYSYLNVAGINSYIKYKSNTDTCIPRRKFLEDLGFQLIDEHIRRQALEPNSRDNSYEVSGKLWDADKKSTYPE